MSLDDAKPFRVFKTNFKKHKTLLKCNETIYHDKVPISTRFYLQLLKKSQFLQHFVDTETYEYASESEKAVTSLEIQRNRSSNRKEYERNCYNLRSSGAKAERKVFYDGTRRRSRCKKGINETHNSIDKLKLPERNRTSCLKEPLAPILKEIQNRERLNASKGSEILKIADKLKSLKTSAEERLDEELLFCKESFEQDLENVEPFNEEKDGKFVVYR